MRFKSGSCLVSASIALLLSTEGGATVTVAPKAPWALVNSVLYYTDSTATAPIVLDTEAGFSTLDQTATAASDTGRTNMVVLDITSDKGFAGSDAQPLVVQVFTTRTSGSTQDAIPLAFVNTADCSASNCAIPSTTPTGLFLAGKSTSSTAVTSLRIGFYLADLCSYVNQQSGAPTGTGCTGAAVTPPVDATPTTFTLTVVVGTAASTTSGLDVSGTEKTSLTVSLNTREPDFTCPNPDTMYFPGDKAIFLRTDFAADITSGNAPLTTLIAVANKGAAANPVVTSSGNTLVGRFPLNSGSQEFGGFSNVTVVNDAVNVYGMDFTVRDASGRVADFASTFDTDCVFSAVRTTEVQGFLKAGNCFIATAAFRSTDAEPVKLLREFRDRVLHRFELGRALTRAYYRWSPAAAEWLMENPEFRFPVLLALAPIQAVAWFSLHPLMLLLLPMLAIILMGMLRRAR